MHNIVIFGPPGAGKGTQSGRLQDKYGIIHLSTGDICRQEILKKTPEGLLAKKLIDGGNFFPDELAYKMVEKFLSGNADAKGFVYDGMPRHVGQVEPFDQMLVKRDSKVDLVLELKVEEEELIKRLLKRGESSGRPDDSGREVILKRLRIYDEVTAPLADVYQKKGVYQTIDGMGSETEIFARICNAVDNLIF
ncbi:MAG: adenylate kinase [Marinifilaceae bacterium]|jgi:adenylate kinase